MIDVRNYEAIETLRSGQAVTIRAIRPEDRILLFEGFKEVSQHSRYLRFFIRKNAITDHELKYFTEVDFVDHVALVVVANVDDEAKIIGGGRYIACQHPAKTRSAEIAFMVHDRYQGQGIATSLLKHLLTIARDGGIAKFEAEVLPENAGMLAVFSRTGLPMSVLRVEGVLRVTLDLS